VPPAKVENSESARRWRGNQTNNERSIKQSIKESCELVRFNVSCCARSDKVIAQMKAADSFLVGQVHAQAQPLEEERSRNGSNDQFIGLTYQVTAGPLGLIWRDFL
jgi:hypothetical protein